jgi:hypothetical protein
MPARGLKSSKHTSFVPICLTHSGYRCQSSLLLPPHVALMFFLMNITELFHTIRISSLGAQAIVQVMDLFPQLIQQPS